VDAADFGLAPNRLTFKLELLQHSGSFKTRGVFANLLMREVPPVGVAAASGGHHGAAVAYAAMRLGRKATIFLPSIASPAKTQRIRVVGVEPTAAPTLTSALAAGRPVDAEAGGIAADSLAPRRTGAQNLAIVQRHVDRVVLVADDAIRDAQAALWQTLRIVAEPGGAAAFAALLSGRYQPAPGERVGVVICGGNTVAVDFAR
jgi:threonine dehydratase